MRQGCLCVTGRARLPAYSILLFAAILAACDREPPAPKLPAVVAETQMVLIPAGEFIRGSNLVDTENLQQRYSLINPLYVDEHPEHRVHLPAFYIDKHEVTNAQYKAFVRAIDYPEPRLWIESGYNVRDDKLESASVENLRWIATEYFKLDADTTRMDKPALLAALREMQRERDKLPVAGVSWYDAFSYCKWAGKRLPTEAEWEKAARGPQGLNYPWGQEWVASNTNNGDDRQDDEPLVPGGTYPNDLSPYGVYDLSGNVSEWVQDWYQPYPGNNDTNEAYGEIHKVIKGGGAGLGHYALSVFFRGARRAHAEPGMTGTDLGFRCAKDATADR